MDATLNMSLDDMVKKSRSERAKARGRSSRGRGQTRFSRGGRATAPVRRGALAVTARPSSFTINKPSRRTRSLPWQSDLFEESLKAAGISGIEVGTKLYVSNLAHGVTNEDILELFSEIGELKRYAIHYDKNGHPSGTAEVVYVRRSDAVQAHRKYDNVLLDAKPMKIEIVGANTERPISTGINVTNTNGGRKRTVSMMSRIGRPNAVPVNRGLVQSGRGGMRNVRGRGASAVGRRSTGGRGAGGGRSTGGRGRGRGGRGKGKPAEKSATELDKELENYHAEAMNTT